MLRRSWWLAGLAMSAAVVVILAPLASSDPDGLERIAEDQGFIETGQDAAFEILPGYTVPGVPDGNLTTILAGLVGVLVVFVLMWAAGAFLARRSRGAR
ncbi:PDGLE domain-containing protein [soil metagenome]